MNRPADYPIQSRQAKKNTQLPQREMTYALLRERISAKQPVTDEMIRTARMKLETAHAKNVKSKTIAGRFTIPSLRSRKGK